MSLLYDASRTKQPLCKMPCDSASNNLPLTPALLMTITGHTMRSSVFC